MASTESWEMFSDITYYITFENRQPVTVKEFPEEMQATTEDFVITGYVSQAFEGQEEMSELMLLSDIGLCPLCGAGDHTTSLMIEFDEPIAALEPDTRITVKGTLLRIDDETSTVAKLVGARISN